MFQRLNENKDLIIVAIASFFIGFGAASFFGVSSDEGVVPSQSMLEEDSLPPLPPMPFEKPDGIAVNTTARGTDVSADGAGSDILQVENQRAGMTVTIRRAEFAQARWIVVREMMENRDAGNILGAGWFPAGTHIDKEVKLLRATMGAEEYYVVVFSDEGSDKRFEYTMDKPLMNVSGSIVQMTFTTVASPAEF